MTLETLTCFPPLGLASAVIPVPSTQTCAPRSLRMTVAGPGERSHSREALLVTPCFQHPPATIFPSQTEYPPAAAAGEQRVGAMQPAQGPEAHCTSETVGKGCRPPRHSPKRLLLPWLPVLAARCCFPIPKALHNSAGLCHRLQHDHRFSICCSSKQGWLRACSTTLPCTSPASKPQLLYQPQKPCLLLATETSSATSF